MPAPRKVWKIVVVAVDVGKCESDRRLFKTMERMGKLLKRKQCRRFESSDFQSLESIAPDSNNDKDVLLSSEILELIK